MDLSNNQNLRSEFVDKKPQSIGLKTNLRATAYNDYKEDAKLPKQVEFVKPKSRVINTSGRNNFVRKSLQNGVLMSTIDKPVNKSMN